MSHNIAEVSVTQRVFEEHLQGRLFNSWESFRTEIMSHRGSSTRVSRFSNLVGMKGVIWLGIILANLSLIAIISIVTVNLNWIGGFGLLLCYTLGLNHALNVMHSNYVYCRVSDTEVGLYDMPDTDEGLVGDLSSPSIDRRRFLASAPTELSEVVIEPAGSNNNASGQATNGTSPYHVQYSASPGSGQQIGEPTTTANIERTVTTVVTRRYYIRPENVYAELAISRLWVLLPCCIAGLGGILFFYPIYDALKLQVEDEDAITRGVLLCVMIPHFMTAYFIKTRKAKSTAVIINLWMGLFCILQTLVHILLQENVADYVRDGLLLWQSLLTLKVLVLHAKLRYFDLANLPDSVTWLVHLAGLGVFFGAIPALQHIYFEGVQGDLVGWVVYSNLLCGLVFIGFLFNKWRLFVVTTIGFLACAVRLWMLLGWVITLALHCDDKIGYLLSSVIVLVIQSLILFCIIFGTRHSPYTGHDIARMYIGI